MPKPTTEAALAEAKPTKQPKATQATVTASSGSKPDIILSMLLRVKGADLVQLQKATGWQPHSIRAAMSRIRKGGVTITRSETKAGSSLYHAKKA